jgi:hypothetical protein
LAVALLLLAACGGSAGNNQSRSVVIPAVAAGASEADCQRLCTRSSTETVCTATHVAFCVAQCRAATRGLPAACASCLIARGATIAGRTENAGKDAYCTVGGPADLALCHMACDHSGAAPPAPDLETLCQLRCAFDSQGRAVLACSEFGSSFCFTDCRAAIANKGRICAQCTIEGSVPQKACLNDECDCSPDFLPSDSAGCAFLCDTLPPPA